MFCSLAGYTMTRGPASVSGHKSRLSLLVVDEEQSPITQAPVWACFSYQKPVNGCSDMNGCFVVEGESPTAGLTYEVRQTNWYTSTGTYQFVARDEEKGIRLPWNPVITAVVRRVVSPIPMYAKRVETKIPSTNQGYAFDLEVGDWAMPVGKGVATDLVFRVDGYWKNYRDNDSTLTVSTGGQSDGLQADRIVYPSSSFLMLRTAPGTGYTNRFEWRRSRSPREGQGNDVIRDDTHDGCGLLFRVRTSLDDKGAATNALYGKIRPDLRFGGAGADGSYLIFTYYLNPTPNDRNLEFDPKRNLFKNLRPMEQVKEP